MVFQQIRHLFITLDATDKATRKLKQVDRTADNLTRTQREAAEATRKYRQRLVAAGFGAAILTGALARMVQMTAEVDRTFARIEGTSGATAEEMARIREEAERIGAEMPVLMSDAAQSFEQLSYAGFSVEEQIAAASAVTELAIAGNMEMAQSARIASSAVRAFSLEATEVEQITESMAATFTNSAFEMAEMAQSLEYAMSTASQANQSFTEVVAALGVLADIGLRGTKAGTALERMFTRLAKQNGETADAMQTLGLTMDDLVDSQGDFLDLSAIVQIISQNIEELGVGGAETLRILQELFGARGGRAAAALVNNTDKFLTKIGDNARAEIHATMATLNELNEEELAQTNEVLNMMVENFENIRFSIGAGSSTQEVLSQLVAAAHAVDESDMANAINMAFDGISARSSEILAQDVIALRQLQEEASSLSDQQLEQRVATEFNLDEQGAGQMAEAIRAGEGTQYLARSIEDMTISAELAQKQVESLWGEIEYLQGSIESLILKMVAGMKPALDVFFSGAKALMDVLNSNRAVVKGLGLGLAFLTATLIVLTVVYAKLALSAHLAAIGFWDQTAAISTNTIATKLNTISKVANEAASLALVVAQLLLGQTTRWNAMQRLGYNNMMRLSTLLKWKDSLATYSLASAEGVLAIGAGAAAFAQGLLNAALEYFETMTVVGQIISIAVGLILIAITLALITERFINFGDAVDSAGGALDDMLRPLDPLIDALWVLVDVTAWTLKLLYELTELTIVVFFWALAEAIMWTVDRLIDFLVWFDSLGVVGKTVLSVMFPILGVFWALTAAADYLGVKLDELAEQWDWFVMVMTRGWARLGIAIGDEIRKLLRWLGDGRDGFDSFSEDVNDTIGGIADFLRELSTIKFWADALRDLGRDGGKAFVDGFVEGIKATVPGIGVLDGLLSGGTGFGGPAGGFSSGMAADTSTGRRVTQTNQNTIIFEGEVHDSQEVERMVNDGMNTAIEEAQDVIQDGLDMASDGDGVLGGLF